MVSTEEIIILVNNIISIYVSFFIVIAGLFGNFINILIFTQLTLFRKNQSAFYLTIAPIVDSCQLTFVTFSRVIASAFGVDATRSSIVWCKFRAYITQFDGTSSAAIICFAAIDQFLSTSYHNRIRQLSTFSLAQRVVGIIIVLSALYCISFPIFNEIRSIVGCATYNSSFNYYYSFIHLCIVIGLLPIVISSFFSLLSYRNVRRITRRQIPIVRRRLDRQLTAMILIRVALFVITTLPFVSFRMYQINNPINQNTSSYLVLIEQLIRTIFTAIYNANYGGSFYVFLISSSRFRRQVKYFFKKTWRKCLSIRKNRNQIEPSTQIPNNQSWRSSLEAD